MLARLKTFWPWFAAAGSGLLGVFCFPPFDQSWLCWLALTPLIAAVWFPGENARRPWLRNLLLGYVTGLVFFTFTFSWLGALGDLYQNLFLHSLSFLLSIYLAMHFAFWAWFVGFLKPKTFTASWRNLLIAFLAASAWATHEWVRGWLFSGFGWNGLGVALHAHFPMIQIAEFTGVTGLSFAIAFANMIAVTTPIRFFLEAKTHQMRPHFDLTLTMVGIVGLVVFGLHRIQSPSPAKSIRVAAVQADVPQLQKLDPQFAPQVFDKFRRLSDIALRANPPPDLLVWPESSVPGDWLDKSVQQFVLEIAAGHHSDFLFGIDDVDGEHSYNAAVLIAADGRTEIYHKVHLVPFGEYIPARHSFPLFAAIASTWVPGDFARGTKHAVFNLTNPDVRVAPLICFEDTVGDLVRRFVLNGANLLVDITNDGWFLRSSASHQHLANAIFRCVENRRPMVRAANTGVTCFVNEFGRVTDILQSDPGETFDEGNLTGVIDVPLATASPSSGGQDRTASAEATAGRQLTFYARHGEWLAESCAGITAIAVICIFVRRKFAR